MLRLLKPSQAPILKRIYRKSLSCSAVSTKRYVIKDHYDFDQKVIMQF